MQDNGIGISHAVLLHLFEMFSQITSALDRSEGGLGIGLSLVRGLVLLHGGSIEARSDGLAKGSEFIVTLPRARAEFEVATASSTAGSTRDPGRRHLRVLIADDNRDNADS